MYAVVEMWLDIAMTFFTIVAVAIRTAIVPTESNDVCAYDNYSDHRLRCLCVLL